MLVVKNIQDSRFFAIIQHVPAEASAGRKIQPPTHQPIGERPFWYGVEKLIPSSSPVLGPFQFAPNSRHPLFCVSIISCNFLSLVLYGLALRRPLAEALLLGSSPSSFFHSLHPHNVIPTGAAAPHAAPCCPLFLSQIPDTDAGTTDNPHKPRPIMAPAVSSRRQAGAQPRHGRRRLVSQPVQPALAPADTPVPVANSATLRSLLSRYHP